MRKELKHGNSWKLRQTEQAPAIDGHLPRLCSTKLQGFFNATHTMQKLIGLLSARCELGGRLPVHRKHHFFGSSSNPSYGEIFVAAALGSN